MYKIVYVKNQLRPGDKKEHTCDTNELFTDAIKRLEIDIDDKTSIYSVFSGEIDRTYEPLIGDEIAIIQTVEGVETLVSIGIFLIKAIVVAAVGYGIGLAVNAIIGKPKQPSYGTNASGIDEGSATYSWNGVQTTQDVGIPIPVVYGEHKVGGNIINLYIRNDGDKNYLNVLLGLCEGEIESITDIEINDNPIANYSDVITDTRMGTNVQSVIANFGDAHNVYNVGVSLNTQSGSHTYTTSDSDVEAFEIQLNFSGGLYEGKDNGDVVDWEVVFQFEYKLHTDSTWTDLGYVTYRDRKRNAFTRSFKKEGLSAGQYDIRVTRDSAASSLDPMKQGDVIWSHVDEVKTDDYMYPNTALLGLEALATEQLNGSTPNFTCIIKGKKISVPKIMNGTSEVDWENYYWNDTAQEYRMISGDASLTWDESTYVERYSANPIWCLKDLLTNTRYGLGDDIVSTNIDSALFLEMSQHCEEKVPNGDGGYEKRYRLDVALDSSTTANDLIIQLCATFNGLPFYSNGAVSFRIDKEEDPTYTFGVGNMLKDSFSQAWKPIAENFNIIDVEYVNKDMNYMRDVVSIADESSLANGDPLRRKSVRIFTTRKSYALRQARYILNLNKTINSSASWKASIDAISCQAGDVVSVSHDVPQWGYSGRVKDVGINGGNHVLQLDRNLTIESGKTYQVMVRSNLDDTIETKDVIISGTAPFTANSLKLDGQFSFTPAIFDNYAFGETGKATKPFRIIGMQIEEKGEVTMTGLEYNSSVYDDTAITIPDTNYSSLLTTIPSITDLLLTQRNIAAADGSHIQLIDVWFNLPDTSGHAPAYQYRKAKIYLSTNGANYSYKGETAGTHFVIDDALIAGETYYVKVTTITQSDLEESLAGAPNDDITLATWSNPPATVTSFAYSWTDMLRLSWGANTEADLLGYEIRLNDTNWGTEDSDLVYKGLTTAHAYVPATRSSITLYIKAYNTIGEYSTTATSISPSNSAPTAPTVTSEVLFNIGRLQWENSTDNDIKYYSVYKDDTNTFGGSEVKIADVAGTSCTIKSNAPCAGEANSATSTTITDATLAGKGVDYFVGDKLLMTNGDAEGDERVIIAYNNTTGQFTLSSAFTATPIVGDLFFITDVAYYKVAGVDHYGEGTLSTAIAVSFEYITADMLGDNILTARKIFAATLSAISADLGTVTAGTLIGALIKSASSGSRIEFDDEYFKAYDDSDNVIFQINMTGDDVGDVIMGDGTNYVKWDKSAGKLIADNLQSSNYVAGTSGWKLNASTGPEFNDGDFNNNVVTETDSTSGSASSGGNYWTTVATLTFSSQGKTLHAWAVGTAIGQVETGDPYTYHQPEVKLVIDGTSGASVTCGSDDGENMNNGPFSLALTKGLSSAGSKTITVQAKRNAAVSAHLIVMECRDQ